MSQTAPKTLPKDASRYSVGQHRILTANTPWQDVV